MLTDIFPAKRDALLDLQVQQDLEKTEEPTI